MRPYLLKGHSRPLTQLKCVFCFFAETTEGGAVCHR